MGRAAAANCRRPSDASIRRGEASSLLPGLNRAGLLCWELSLSLSLAAAQFADKNLNKRTVKKKRTETETSSEM